MDERQQLLAAIEKFCEREGMTPSAFGRKAMGDGRFVGRLRDGRQMRAATLARARQFLGDHAPKGGGAAAAAGRPAKPAGSDEKGAFRFYDNRQKYLMFVNTCSEKWVVSERAGMELGHVHPRPPALRVFDAGMGDGTVLTGVMRNMHRRFPTFPFYVVGKEISVEDVRLCLEKMPDRLFEHPATVLVVTNMHYSEAPSLQPRSMQAAATLNWIETPLSGNTSHEFHEQIAALQPTLADTWRVRPSPKTGNPLYVRASVLVLYREDHKFLLDPVIPRPGRASEGYDLVIASQPYRARMPAKFKVQKVLAPLSRSLAPGGRLLCIQSHGEAIPGSRSSEKSGRTSSPFRPTATCCSRRSRKRSARAGATSGTTPILTAARSSATTCTRCRPRSRAPASAPRRSSPPGTRRSMSLRSRTRGWRAWSPTAPIWMPRARS